MKITIDNVLKQQNKTRYWLSKQIDCNYQSLCFLCNNQTKSISFNLIQKICNALDCTPNKIFDINNQ